MDLMVVEKLHEWLGSRGRHYFRTLAKLYKGDVIPVIKIYMIKDKNLSIKQWPKMPHSTHFREGMQIRNFLRGLPECQEWSFEDFESGYVDYIKEAMKEYPCEMDCIKSRLAIAVPGLSSKMVN